MNIYIYCCVIVRAEFAAVAQFCVIADTAEQEFMEYLEDVGFDTNFVSIFDFYLNRILANNTPCCEPGQGTSPPVNRRRLLQMIYRTHFTYELGIEILRNKSNLALQLPMGYQGIFMNDPPVTADITILLLIIFGIMSICAFICWCCHRQSCYSTPYQAKLTPYDHLEFEEEYKQDDKEDNIIEEERTSSVFELPLKH